MGKAKAARKSIAERPHPGLWRADGESVYARESGELVAGASDEKTAAMIAQAPRLAAIVWSLLDSHCVNRGLPFDVSQWLGPIWENMRDTLCDAGEELPPGPFPELPSDPHELVQRKMAWIDWECLKLRMHLSLWNAGERKSMLGEVRDVFPEPERVVLRQAWETLMDAMLQMRKLVDRPTPEARLPEPAKPEPKSMPESEREGHVKTLQMTARLQVMVDKYVEEARAGLQKLGEQAAGLPE